MSQIYLFRSLFLFYADNRETFLRKCERNFLDHINRELGPKRNLRQGSLHYHRKDTRRDFLYSVYHINRLCGPSFAFFLISCPCI